MKNIWFISILVLLLSACGESDSQNCLPDVDVSNIKVDVSIERTDKQLFQLETKEQVKDFLDKNILFSEHFLQRSQFPHDSIVVNMVHGLATDSSLRVLHQDVDKAYGDMKEIKKQFEEAFKRVKYYYPDFKAPKIQTIITGYGKGADLYITKDLIVIGMEFFMGPEYKYQPEEPEYIARRYKQSAIVPFVMQVVSTWFNEYDDKDESALSDMVFYGKCFYFMESVIPCLPDSTVLGYTAAQTDSIQKYKEVIWAHYIDKKVFFEKNHLVKKDYLDEAPFTLPISQEWCPGAIGRWTGLKIIKKYMSRNPKTTLPELMSQKNAQKILEDSKYKGE